MRFFCLYQSWLCRQVSVKIDLFNIYETGKWRQKSSAMTSDNVQRLSEEQMKRCFTGYWTISRSDCHPSTRAK
jgi:hypothetical protein